MRRSVTWTLVVGAALLAATPALAQTPERGTLLAQEDETVNYATSLRINVHKRAFTGRVLSEFTQEQEADDAPGCVEDRRVQLFIRRTDGGLRRLGSAVTDEEGRWRIRTDVRRKRVYVVRVLPQEFLFSPYYGRLERAVCLQEQARVRAPRVLGVQLTRQDAIGGRLARTGLHHGWWAGVGFLLLTGGEVLRRAASRPRR